MITIERKHPTFFAEVKGVDISKPLSPELFAEILTAFHDNAVLVFRAQPLTHQQHIDFSTNFGPLFEVTNYHRKEKERALPSKLTDISNIDHTGAIQSGDNHQRHFNLGNRIWHTDNTFKHVPARCSLLYATEVPSSGGETEFADMRAAYDALPQDRKDEIEELVVEHSIVYSRQRAGVRHEIVHNKTVVENLKTKGAIFVEKLDDIPDGAVTIFSAHGVSRKVEDGAEQRGLSVIDATCPLVSKVHNEAQRYSLKGHEIVLIGHRGHPEVVGTTGQVPGKVHLVSTLEDVALLEPKDSDKLAYVTQTTLSVDDTRHIIDALCNRFPEIVGPDVKDICYATQNRQSAVRMMVDQADVILVVGAHYSSNSNRLREIGEEAGVSSYLIPDADALEPDWLKGAKIVGVTAGASAPEELVLGLVERLSELYDVSVKDFEAIEENVQFKLPKELADVV